MDFEEQEDEEMAGSYDSLSASAAANKAPPLPESRSSGARYRECLKNHAVGLGGHAVDGCGEFLPAGPDGSIDALKCAACLCHRNFHRRELDLRHHPPYSGQARTHSLTH